MRSSSSSSHMARRERAPLRSGGGEEGGCGEVESLGEVNSRSGWATLVSGEEARVEMRSAMEERVEGSEYREAEEGKVSQQDGGSEEEGKTNPFDKPPQLLSPSRS